MLSTHAQFNDKYVRLRTTKKKKKKYVPYSDPFIYLFLQHKVPYKYESQIKKFINKTYGHVDLFALHVRFFSEIYKYDF